MMRIWRRSISRAAVVIALAVFALGMNLPEAYGLRHGLRWAPTPDFGFFVNAPDGTVTEVVPTSAAEDADIQAGDHADLRGLSLQERLILNSDAGPYLGENLSIPIKRGETVRTVHLTARFLTLEWPLRGRLLFALKRVSAIIFVLVGMFLVFLRPCRMTWGFYLYALLPATFTSTGFYSFLPAGWHVGLISGLLILGAAGPAGFLVFASRFPSDSIFGWWRWVDRAAPIGFAILAAIGLYVGVVQPYFLVSSPAWTTGLPLVLAFAALMIGTVILIDRFRHTHGLERERIKWVVVALLLGFGVTAFYLIGTFIQTRWPIATLGLGRWPLFLALTVNVVLPLTVAYAVIRHRILSVDFVISRVLIVGIFAAVLVGTFASIDWAMTRLAVTHFEVAANIATALILGYCFRGLHQRLNDGVDALFFRQRLQAKQRSRRVIDAMYRCESIEALSDLLTIQTADTFDLAAAAVFQRVDDGGFIRVSATGWPAGTVRHVFSDEPLARNLRNEPRSLDLDTAACPIEAALTGAARPSLIAPIFADDQMVAASVYSAHRTGAVLDSDETTALESVAAEAGIVYARLRAQATEHKAESLRQQLEAFRLSYRLKLADETARPPQAAPAAPARRSR